MAQHAVDRGSGASHRAVSPSDLDERYGRGQRRRIDRRIAWTLAIALLAAGAIVLTLLVVASTRTVEFRDLAYEVLDDRSVDIDFEVTAPPGSEVACAIEALSPSYAQVGWKIIELPASDVRTRQFSETLVTVSPATTGYVKSCWLPDSQPGAA